METGVRDCFERREFTTWHFRYRPRLRATYLHCRGLILETRRSFRREIEREARRDVTDGGSNEEKCLRSATLKPERVLL